MKHFGRWISLAGVCLALSNLCWSQASSSSLRGTVSDPSGSAIAGATVTIANEESKATRTAITGEVGDYAFLALPPGTYTLSVNATGFARYMQTSIQLLVNTPATANVRLKVGSVTENVNVTGVAPALNLVDASIGNPFDENQVKQIPLDGRNVPELLSLQAGVAYTGNRPDMDDPKVKDQDTRNGAVNGARSDQSNVTLDGVDVNDQSSGYAFTSVLPVTLDSVQEFRVTTSNYNADQGAGSGAQVALITKSGTNAIHGSLYEYHRNTFTSASDYFLQQPLKLIRNIFGASVGGPIKKDRLFYFTNYEGTRRREDQSTVRTIPTSSLCQGNLRYQDVTGGVTTLTPTDIKNLDPWTSEGINPAGAGINPAIRNGSTGYFDTTFCTGKFNTNDTSVGDGLNYSGFRFGAPVTFDNNAFVAKLDYHLTSDGRHTIFWRGALQNVYNPQEPFLPGSPSMQTMTDHSKGFVVGYTAVLRPTMVNAFHWGFTRQSTGILGNTNQQWNVFYGLDQGIVYSHNAQTPVHNFLDDFSWTKGAHTFQFGGNVGFARNPRLSYEHSFSVGKGATNWMSPTGFANTATHPDPNNPLVCGAIGTTTGGSPLDPCHGTNPNTSLPYPEPASTPQFDYPIMGLLGMVSDIVGNYNYDKSGTLLGAGVPVQRKYGLNWYELYGQDSWRVKPNLTITYGLRWSLFPPPWEVNGFQASPTCDSDPAVNPGGCPSWAYNLGTEFAHNAQAMKQGIGYDATPLVSFILGGPGNPGPGFYSFEKSDFSPRVSFAYSPRPHDGWLRKLLGDSDKTVIRGGFSKVYDRAGMQLLSTFDANAPGGLSATVQNPCCAATDPAGSGTPYDTADGVPRITNINQIPQTNSFGDVFFEPAPPGQFPQTPPALGQAITWGIDQSIKTPYAYAFDLSFGRELPKRFSLQLAYVNRLGRNLLTQRDLRQPIDLYDPQSGVDYFSAATALAKVAQSQLAAAGGFIDPTKVTNNMVGQTYLFWQHMISPLVNSSSSYQNLYTGFTATQPGSDGLIQAIYDLYYDPFLSYLGNEVVGLGYTDIYYGLTDNSGNGNFYGFKGPACTNPLGFCPGTSLNNQATSMYAWSSIGSSNYNALQATLRKQAGHGLQFDFNYTFSKSIDITSNATRLGFSSSTNVGAPGSRLANAFSPGSRRAVSDFDTTHQFNADWIWELPFGKGKPFAGNSSGVAEAVIGGWELSGLARWTSGFPFTVDNGNFWPTDWDEQGIAQMLVRPTTGHYRQPDGSISVFANPATAFANFQHPYPGQAGSRNVIRGDGYAGLDMALNKRWRMPFEGHSLQFRWEVFNVPNLHRFNVDSGLQTGTACACIASLQQLPQSFGDYTGVLTQARVMQFALRYEF